MNRPKWDNSAFNQPFWASQIVCIDSTLLLYESFSIHRSSISESRITYPGGGTHVHFVDTSLQCQGENCHSVPHLSHPRSRLTLSQHSQLCHLQLFDPIYLPSAGNVTGTSKEGPSHGSCIPGDSTAMADLPSQPPSSSQVEVKKSAPEKMCG